MEEMWLKCNVSKGMFSDECAIVLTTKGGRVVSSFVPKSSCDVEQGRVKVRVFEDEGTRWAVLPDDMSTSIAIDDTDLVPA